MVTLLVLLTINAPLSLLYSVWFLPAVFIGRYQTSWMAVFWFVAFSMGKYGWTHPVLNRYVCIYLRRTWFFHEQGYERTWKVEKTFLATNWKVIILLLCFFGTTWSTLPTLILEVEGTTIYFSVNTIIGLWWLVFMGNGAFLFIVNEIFSNDFLFLPLLQEPFQEEIVKIELFF